MLKRYEELLKYLSTFKIVSKGGENSEPMINSKAEVYNFDKAAKPYARKYKINIPSTNDALYINEDNVFYFIEFKSGSIDKKQLLYKAYDSAIVLADLNIFNSFDEMRKNTKYILVYKHLRESENVFNSESRGRIADSVRKRARQSSQLFDTKHIKNMLYSDVHTLEVEKFIEKFGKEFCIN